jgi:hypothetical protein
MPDTDAAYGPSMRPKLVAAVLVAIILASCSLSSSPSSSSLITQHRVALEDARVRLARAQGAMRQYTKAVRFFFFRMENPYGTNGKAAIRRVSKALESATRSAAAARRALPPILRAQGQAAQESTEAMLAVWSHRVPRLRATVAGHRELKWGRWMDPVDVAHDAVNASLESALYEVHLLQCEGWDGYWEPDEQFCDRG